ncbi:RNA-binding region RNP-1 domain-containing protein [Tieghemostelium lacteum]|uniref:RNA-binding region RNP-1 domain-containing protein n=1 Tax=Tieghemostelium lacteum TaxID=361077 RepID=A0A151Z302_TIELA|nr:RNA-binding region RNP-1 domain-containing protein [Tieghemostelium lacteum]|eukprot:KYQ88329.1 RNA-binding region RNP-1 domain-containing protein [Tieghemostelium lacteum]
MDNRENNRDIAMEETNGNGNGNGKEKSPSRSRSGSRNRNYSRERSSSRGRGRGRINYEDLAERRVYIGKISPKTTKEDLETAFKKFGKILSCDLKPGYAFVEFETDKSAKEAIEEMDGTTLAGEKIQVEKSHSGKRNPDECFNCKGKGHWAKNCPKAGRYVKQSISNNQLISIYLYIHITLLL